MGWGEETVGTHREQGYGGLSTYESLFKYERVSRGAPKSQTPDVSATWAGSLFYSLVCPQNSE